ncbi:MAG TPA: type II secretion system protein [Phycisphaerae bacterium]|nr:type II secretion system protein [Phycisphaerae bacterium]
MRTQTWPCAGRRSAFTLVELLIVMTILALLVGILVPAAGHVMKYAEVITCQANLKQIALSVLNYTTDYQGAIPPTQVRRPDGTIYYWCNLLAVRDLAAENTADKTGPGGDPMRTTQNTVLLCPTSSEAYVRESDSGDSTGPFLGPDHTLAQGWYRVGNTSVATDCSYYWNGYTGNDVELKRRIPSLYVDESQPNAKQNYHNISEVPQRSHLVMVADGVFWLDYRGNARPQRIAARHPGEYGSRMMTVMAFYDAHVEQFDRYAPGEYPRRVWSREEVVEEMHLPLDKRDKKPIMPRKNPDLGGGPPYFLLPMR